MRRYDVVIAGAGPSGLLLWECLTDAGLDVLLIDAGPNSGLLQRPKESDPGIWAYETGDGQKMQWQRVHGVGGRTLGWGGFCHRFPQVVFDDGNWPYGASTLTADYARAERWLHVMEGILTQEHRAAAQRLGWSFVPLRGARVDGRIWTALDARGASAAIGNSVAAEIDCERRSAHALRVLRHNGQEEWIAARAFALAAGPIESTRILLASRFGDATPRIGQGLVDHHTTGWMLLEPLPAPRAPGSVHLEGALVQRFVNVDAASCRPYRGGFTIEITGPRGLVEMPTVAAELQITAQDAQRLRVIFINAMGETAPHEDRRMTLSTTRTDALGRAVPVLHVDWAPEDRRMAEEMAAACLSVAEALAAAGSELYPLQDPAAGAGLFHEAGTCAMGEDDQPCDPTGRLRSADNVWLADASVFPSAGDRHPTLTLLAHTLRVARSMCRHFQQVGS